MATRPHPFPPDLPPSTTDAAPIIEYDWCAFSGLDNLVDHWDRPGWRDNVPILYWLLPLDEHPELVRLVDTCQRALRTVEGLDIVPPESLHITLARVGPEADITTKEAQGFAEQVGARIRRHCAFDITVGPLAGSRGAIRFSVTPWRDLRSLTSDLSSTTADVLGRNPENGDRFRPHVSIAYNDRHRAAGPVVAAVDRLRHLPPVEVRVDSVHLVSLVRRQRAYHWTTRKVMHLPS